MHWILEKITENIHKSAQDAAQVALAEILKDKGLPHSFHQIIPFSGELYPALPESVKNAICIGPYSMRHSAKANGLYPGVMDIEDLDFVVQKDKWGEEMLNADSRVICFNNLEKLPEDSLYFVRPVDDSKCFAGNVFTGSVLNVWKDNVQALDKHGDNYGALNGKTLLQLSSVKDIKEEYRFWIVEGNIAAYSLYKRNGKVFTSKDIDDKAISYTKDMIRLWMPNDAFVIDIAKTSQGFKIVEINTLNAAGFYEANLESLVDALERAFSE